MTTAKIEEDNLPKGNLIWKMLPDFLMERGVQITGWPEGVLFPTQRFNRDSGWKSAQGIKDIGINGARLLAERLESLNDPQESMRAVNIGKCGMCSH